MNKHIIPLRCPKSLFSGPKDIISLPKNLISAYHAPKTFIVQRHHPSWSTDIITWPNDLIYAYHDQKVSLYKDIS